MALILEGQRIVVEKTYAQMAALILAAELNPFLWYKITDRGDNGLVFRAAAVDRLESTGIRYMLCPATYAVGADAYSNDWIGVWNATKQLSATEGQLCIWNGLVWVAGAVLGAVAPDVTMDEEENPVVSGWTVIPKASFTNHEYVEMIFGVTYDFANDWINKQWDGIDNVFGMSKSQYIDYYEPEDETINLVDYCDWNNILLFGNNCFFIYNNSIDTITYNTCLGIISGNSGYVELSVNSNNGDVTNNAGNGIIAYNSNNGLITGNSSDTISNNSNNGSIRNNVIAIIQVNSNIGGIENNTTVGAVDLQIANNSNNGTITGSWDADVTDAVVDKIGTAE